MDGDTLEKGASLDFPEQQSRAPCPGGWLAWPGARDIVDVGLAQGKPVPPAEVKERGFLRVDSSGPPKSRMVSRASGSP